MFNCFKCQNALNVTLCSTQQCNIIISALLPFCINILGIESVKRKWISVKEFSVVSVNKTASVVQGQRAGLQYPSSRVQPGRSRRIFRAKKILSAPSFGGEVKPSVPYRRFAACKRSLNLRGSRNLGKITGQISRPQFHLSLLGSLASLGTYRHQAVKVGTCKKVGESNGKLPP